MNQPRWQNPKLTIKPPTEHEIQISILRYLGAVGVLAFRSNTGAMLAENKGKRRFVHFGEKGMPDIHGVLPGGRAIYIEVKRPGAKVSAWQTAQLDRLTRQGAVAFIAHSLSEVVSVLPGGQSIICHNLPVRADSRPTVSS